jgi:hypothetical protein
MVWGLFGSSLGGGSSDPEVETDLVAVDDEDDMEEDILDDSIVGKNVLLRGGMFSKFQSSANVMGMMAYVKSMDTDTCT